MADVRAIVVNYKIPEDTISCSNALLASEGLSVAVSIIDNSSEHSVEKLTGYASTHQNVEVLEMADNIGFGAANNKVLNNRAKYKENYFAIINPDSKVHPKALNLLLVAMKGYGANLAGGTVLNEDGSIQRTCFRNIPNLTRSAIYSLKLDKIFTSLADKSVNAQIADIPSDIAFAPAISGAFMVISRRGLEIVGGFDEQYFMHVEDLDLCQRFSDASERILFVPQAELVHKKGEASGARPVRVQWYLHQGIWRFYRKFQSSSHNFFVRALVFILISARFFFLALKNMIPVGR